MLWTSKWVFWKSFFCKNQRISSTLIHVLFELIESKSLCIWWRILFLLSPKLFLHIGYLFLFLSLSYAHTCTFTHTVRLFFNITSSNAQQSIAQTHSCISLTQSQKLTQMLSCMPTHMLSHSLVLEHKKQHSLTFEQVDRLILFLTHTHTLSI